MINPIHIPTVPQATRLPGVFAQEDYYVGGGTRITLHDEVLGTCQSYTLDHADSASAHAMTMDWFLREYEERRLRIVRSFRDIFAPGSVWEEYNHRAMWPLLGDRIGPRICSLVQSISDIRVHILDENYPGTYTASAAWVLDHLEGGCYEEYVLWAESVGETAYTQEEFGLVRKMIRLTESYLRGTA